MKRAAALALAMSLIVPGRAGAEEALPDELQDLSILDRSGSQAPLDVPLTDQNGRRVTLGSYLGDGKPLVLVMAYYRCPMLCTLVVNGLTDGLKELAWTAGREYRVLVVSIDPSDTPAIAGEKRQGYLRDYGRPVNDGGFEFLTGDEASVRRLADAVGFRYRYDERTEQFGHAAGAFVLTPSGVVSRTLHGIEYRARPLRLAMVEASEGKLGGAWDQVVLFCYHYDPDARGYVLAATRLMRVGAAMTVLVLGVALAGFWRRERREGGRREGRAFP